MICFLQTVVKRFFYRIVGVCLRSVAFLWRNVIADHSHQQTKVIVSKIKTLCCLHPIVVDWKTYVIYPYLILIPWLQPWNPWSRTLVKRIQKSVVITWGHLALRHLLPWNVQLVLPLVYLERPFSLQDLMRLIKWIEQSNLLRISYWSCHMLWSNPQRPDISSRHFSWTWCMQFFFSICPKGTSRLW